jgi:protocatechuate 3,4-dioxygenase beta subunit
MKSAFRQLILLLLIASLAMAASGQTQEEQPKGSVSGSVTIGGKAAPGVIVTIKGAPLESATSITQMFEGKPVTKTTTDEEGRYTFSDVAPGRYSVSTYTPSLVGRENDKTINVGAGEEVKKIDFSLVPGGVITGRVVDANGRPVIAEMVKVTRVEGEQKKPGVSAETFDIMGLVGTDRATDDRGVYRIYGLEAGRYIVSIGHSGQGGGPMLKRRYTKETFHPGFTDKAKAAAVEVKAGGETTGVDIRLELPAETFKVSGRIVDADTGKPVSNIYVNYMPKREGSEGGGMSGLGALSNPKGEFRFDMVVPGRYSAFAFFEEDSEYYSDTAQFEVKVGNVTGVEVKLHRGQSLGGIVRVEGTDDPEALASVSQLQLMIGGADSQDEAPRFNTTRINPDGSFRFRGLRAGKVNILLNKFFTPTTLNILRIERGGMLQPAGITLARGETINDIVVVLGHTRGVIRGQVVIEGGTLPDGLQLEVSLRRAGEQFAPLNNAIVDADGRFAFQELLPGEYELTLQLEKASQLPGAPSFTPVKQTVRVSNENEAVVVLRLDLSERRRDDD